MPTNPGIGWAPTDTQVELQNIDRQRKYADLLRQQSSTPLQGQMVGSHYVAPAWTQQLAHVLSGVASQDIDQKSDTRQIALGQALRQKSSQDVNDFVNANNGYSAQPPVSDDEGNAYPAVPVAADRNKALGIALNSQNPMLQQAGGKIIEQMSAAPKWEKVELPNPDGSKRVGYVNTAAPNPVSTFQSGGVAPVKQEFVNGQGVNPYTATPVGQAIPKQPDAPNPGTDLVIPGPNGQMIPNAPLIGAKTGIARAGASSQNVNVAGPKAFETELGKLDAEQLGAFRTAAQTAQSTLGTVQQLRAAEKQGAYSGGGANAKVAAANLINGFTGITPKGLVGSQLYNAEASKLVLDKVKGLGANPSNADRDFIEKTVPQLATSQEARTQMTNYLEKKSQEAIDLYKRADSHARSNHGLGGFDQFPQQAAPGGAAPSGFKIIGVQ